MASVDYFQRKLDDKRRLTIPAELRSEFSSGVVITRGFGQYLHLYPKSVWDREVEAALTGAGNVLDHTVTIQAQRYTPVDADLIPTGTHEDVAATAMDFRSAVAIGARIEQVEGGYDHNYVISSRDENHTLVAAVPRLAAEVADPATGRKLTCYTTEPGVQFYTGNFLDGSITGNGGVYKKHAGFTLEAQHFPDSVNRPNFPDTILRPGEVYRQVTIYKLAF